MDFFDSLEERTVDVMHSEAWATRYRKEVREHGADKSDVLVHLTIEATIEALKEMMVIPIESCKIEHCEDITVVSSLDPDGEFTPWFCIADEIIRTDGEEVVVMVFKGGDRQGGGLDGLL